MNRISFSNQGMTGIQSGIIIVLGFILFSIIVIYLNRSDVNWIKTEYEKSLKKTRLIETMKSELLLSAEAEKSSVMADTDEASKFFAEQSFQSSQRVDTAEGSFKDLIVKNSDEEKYLKEFSDCWDKQKEIDNYILSLAVQNTNLNAFRLSFGPAAISIGNLEKSINEMTNWIMSSFPNDREMILSASRVLIGTLEIYALESPHIAEATDAKMDGIEIKMKRLDEQIRDTFSVLNKIPVQEGLALINAAYKNYEEFQVINQKIIELSRRNTNVLSFSESLGKKRNTMAMCLNHLNILQEAVQDKMKIKATR
jgi:hypothetical protein